MESKLYVARMLGHVSNDADRGGYVRHLRPARLPLSSSILAALLQVKRQLAFVLPLDVEATALTAEAHIFPIRPEVRLWNGIYS